MIRIGVGLLRTTLRVVLVEALLHPAQHVTIWRLSTLHLVADGLVSVDFRLVSHGIMEHWLDVLLNRVQVDGLRATIDLDVYRGLRESRVALVL